MDAATTRETAIVLATVIPALLIAGLIGPFMLTLSMQWPERQYVAWQTTIVMLYEGTLLVAIATNNQALLGGVVYGFWIPVLTVCTGILMSVWAWAKLSPSERAANAAQSRLNRERRSERRRRNQDERHESEDATRGDAPAD